MKNIDEAFPILNIIISGLAKHFGPDCELVVHDYSKDFERTIVGIVNGEVTGRQVGDCATGVGLRILQGEQVDDGCNNGLFNYLSQTKDGRILKSSTIYLKDNDNKIIGSICINNDITEIMRTKNSLETFINVGHDKPLGKPDTVFVGKVEELLTSMINDSINKIGVPVAQMTRDQKISGIKFLKENGAFKIQKASDIIAQYYDVSKFTVYNYLNEIEIGNNRNT